MKKNKMFLAIGMLAVSLMMGCQNKEQAAETTTLETTQQAGDETETMTQPAPLSDYSEYLTLGQYKGIEIAPVSVTEEELEEQLNQMFRDTVQTGDTVNIDYVGTLDGVAFEGGTAQGQNLTIGSGGYIDGFEDGLIDHKTGEEVTLNLTFPDPYTPNTDMSGKAVEFRVTINSIRGVEPELTESYVKENTDYTTVEQYREGIRTAMLEQKQGIQKDQIWATAVGNATVNSYPENEVEYYKQQVHDLYEYQLSYQGNTIDDWLASIGSSKEEFEDYCKSYAESIVKQSMLMREIARAEAMNITDEEYKEAIAKEAEANGCSEEELITNYYGSEDSFKESLLLDKIITFVADQAVETQPEETSSSEEQTESSEGEETTAAQ